MVITGFHAIEEALTALSNGKGASLCYSKVGPRVKKLLALCNTLGVAVARVSDDEITKLVAALPPHLQDARGVVLKILTPEGERSNFVNYESVVTDERVRTLLALDGVTDVHNVASIARSALLFSVDAIIIPSSKSISKEKLMDSVVLKASAGASAHIKFCVVGNLVDALKKAKAQGFWVYGADTEGEALSKVEFADKALIVLGSEGAGMARLVRDNVDKFVTIPMKRGAHAVDSLNVSVSAGIILERLWERREGDSSAQ